MRLLPTFAAIVTMAFAHMPAKAERLRVVVTIAPLHSLVANIMTGVGEPGLMLTGAVSPHDFALAPSDVRRINTADLVVWVGPPLESFLVNLLASAGERQLSLLEIPEIEPRHYEEGSDDGHGENDRHGASIDPHIWLDPLRAKAIVGAVAGRLAALDPASAAAYRTNAAALKARLDTLDEAIRAQLLPVADRPFIAFHDAYGYYAERYGLQPAGYFSAEPQRRPGARTIARLNALVKSRKVACAFAEPQFDTRIIEAIAGGKALTIGRLDPLGFDLAPGPGLYETLLIANTNAIVACLGGKP